MISNTILTESVETTKNSICVEFGSETKDTDVMIYFKYSSGKSKGINILNCWVGFAFILNKQLDRMTSKSRVLGRKVILDKSMTFDELCKNKDIGKYSATGTFAFNKEKIIFTTSEFSSKWSLSVEGKGRRVVACLERVG